jgi:flagellar hook-basal body complex protein FliE
MAIEQLLGSIRTVPIGPTEGPGVPDPAAPGFGESLARLVDSANASNAAANEAVSSMLAGTGDVHDAMIALQRADLTLQLTVQIRNKLVQAYQDIMRMPV